MVLGFSGIDHHHHRAENDKDEESQKDEAAIASGLRSFRLFFLHFLSPSGFLDEPRGVPAFERTRQVILRATPEHCQPEIRQGDSASILPAALKKS
jgi:hypothetical protein